MNQPNGNNFEAMVRGLIEEIDAMDEEIARAKAVCAEVCAEPRAQIKAIKARAKEEGISPVAFAEVLKQHRAARAEHVRLAAMEPDDRSEFERLEAALGVFAETPLGAAALARAKAADAILAGR
jgi:hypothetical protein